ncbi:formate dehydrogenase-O, large subunit [Escherichia coli]|uniref:Formate dehydrogenase-O, large subunit n=1 Tax=Escherichia coli TaxID=562 RepID=A0A2X1MW38_ECOLX|nr:formate dehydrogenase-O, large subunit [Escherichia coli]
MQVSRRQFFKICAGGMAGTTAAALGFAPSVALAETRQYKLLRTRETRNTCTYCSVGCGLLMYSLGDGAKNAKASIFHIEGDPDHPGQPRCTLSERRWPGGFHPLRKPSEVSGIPCARF